MPSASDRTAVKVNPGRLRTSRAAYRKSENSEFIGAPQLKLLQVQKTADTYLVPLGPRPKIGRVHGLNEPPSLRLLRSLLRRSLSLPVSRRRQLLFVPCNPQLPLAVRRPNSTVRPPNPTTHWNLLYSFAISALPFSMLLARPRLDSSGIPSLLHCLPIARNTLDTPLPVQASFFLILADVFRHLQVRLPLALIRPISFPLFQPRSACAHAGSPANSLFSLGCFILSGYPRGYPYLQFPVSPSSLESTISSTLQNSPNRSSFCQAFPPALSPFFSTRQPLSLC